MINTLVQLLWILPFLAGQPVDPANVRAEEILRGLNSHMRGVTA